MYEPRLEGAALPAMGQMPPEALDVLVEVMALICTDPFDRLHSVAVRSDLEEERIAELGDFGFIEFRVDISARAVYVFRFVWTG